MTDFEEVPVEVPIGDGLVVRGVLSRPITAGYYVAPGVVFQSPPGPIDADHHVSGELRVDYGKLEIPIHAHLAEDLASAGVVVLRYDTRICFSEENERCRASQSDYPGDPMAALADDFADDTAAAARWLAARPEVRDRDITAIGQSFGGVYVPAITLREEAISGGVLLGTPAMSFIDSLALPYERWADELEAANPDDTLIATLRGQAMLLRQTLGEIEAGTYTGETFSDRPLVFWENQIHWHERIQDNFLEAAAAEPFLILQGQLDYDVLEDSINLYGSWTAEAGLEDVRVQLMPDHGHWLIRLQSTGAAESRLSSEVAAEILDWLQPAE